MKIGIEHVGSCLGATGGSGQLIVRDALAKGHSVVLVRSRARARDVAGRKFAVPPDQQALRTELADRHHFIWTFFEKGSTQSSSMMISHNKFYRAM
jgi:putative NADH-flavin reductase